MVPLEQVFDKLVRMVRKLAREVGTSLKVLSPSGLPSGEGGRLQPMRQFPWWAVAVVAVCLPLLVWLLSWSALDHRADAIVRALGGK